MVVLKEGDDRGNSAKGMDCYGTAFLAMMRPKSSSTNNDAEVVVIVKAKPVATQAPTRRIKKFFCALLLILLPIPTHAAQDSAAIKTAYLYRILHFVEFPNDLTEQENFTICILGKDNPFKYTQTKLEQRRIENHQITLIQKQRDESLSGCRVAFIADSEKSHITKTVNSLASQGILTISSISQFAKVGGMVGFTEYNDTLRLEINTKALEAADFEIDPHLLEVSLNVY